MILSKMYKKALASFVLLGLLAQGLLLPRLVSANNTPPEGAWWAPTAREFNQKVNGAPESEIFGERYTHAQVWWIIHSIQSFVFGTDVMKCAADAGERLELFGECGILASNSGGGVFGLASITGSFVSAKPASGIGYVSYLANKVGFPVAQAQEGGFGFTTALSPLLGIWAAARNAAYALMTLAVIILAFMVMFRMKISPQASVTVMSAIPRIVIGLILITFSFAIAGFVVDLTYVAQGIIAALVYTSGLVNQSNWTIIDTFNQMNDVGAGLISYGLLVIAWAFVTGLTGGGVTALITGGGAVVVSAVITLIAIIVFLIALVRTFFVMLKTYVMILFHVIALPFAALGYVAMPSGNMFMQLLRSLIGHVSVFVTITVVVMFAHLMFWNMAGAQYLALGGNPANPPGTVWAFNPYRATVRNAFPPSGAGMPGFGATDVSGLAIFIGLVILLMAPSVANNIKSLITSGRPAREGISVIGAGFIGGIGGGVASAVQREGGAAVVRTLQVWGGNAASRLGGAVNRIRSVGGGNVGGVVNQRLDDLNQSWDRPAPPPSRGQTKARTKDFSE